MRFDLAFVLVDLGDPFYKQAASEMIRSARRAYKDHDMRVVQLSDKNTAHCPDADIVMAMDTDVPKEQVCQFKGVAIAEHALRAETPVIFTDVDLLFNNDGLVKFNETPRVYLLWRDNMPSMPFNTGLILAYQKCPDFWSGYRAACDNLPAEVAGWYGDQFGIIGPAYEYFGKGVDWLGMDGIAPAIDTLPSAPLTTPAVHFKGRRKNLMLPYARMLDGGEGFEFARPASPTGVPGNWKPDVQPFAGDATKLYVGTQRQPMISAAEANQMAENGAKLLGWTF